VVTQGFEVPIHQSVIRPQLMMGIPRQLALVLYTIILALTLPLGSWYAIPPGLFLHFLFAAAAKKDPGFWDVFRRAFTYRAFYRG
jgi:type IV secretion system protein VirB3